MLLSVQPISTIHNIQKLFWCNDIWPFRKMLHVSSNEICSIYQPQQGKSFPCSLSSHFNLSIDFFQRHINRTASLCFLAKSHERLHSALSRQIRLQRRDFKRYPALSYHGFDKHMDSGRHIHPKFLAQSLKLSLKPLFHPHAECCLRHIEHPLEYPKAYIPLPHLYGSVLGKYLPSL